MARVSKAFYLGSWLSGIIAGTILAWMGFGILQADERLLPIGVLITLVGDAAAIYALVVWAILVHRMWKALPAEYARTSPGKAVGFLFIPFFNFYWIFQAIWGWTKDINRLAREEHSEVPHMPEGLALTLCILSLVCLIPVVNIVVGLVNIVLLAILISRICDGVNALAGESTAAPPAPAPPVAPSAGAPSSTAPISGMAVAALVLSILGFCTAGVTAIVGLVLGIVALGRIRASGDRLRGRGMAIAAIAVSAVAVFVVVLYLVGAVALWMMEGRPASRPDFAQTGGYALTCEIDVPDDANTGQVVDEVMRILKKRIDPDSNLGILLRPVDSNAIEISVPVRSTMSRLYDDPQELIKMLQLTGVLEFRIAAEAGALPDESQYRGTLTQQGRMADSNRPYGWFAVDDVASFAVSPSDEDAFRENAEAYFATRGLVAQEYNGQYYLLLSNESGARLTRSEPQWSVQSASSATDSMGMPAVSFTLDSVGARIMGNMTEQHIGKSMAVLIDDRVLLAPTIQSRLTNTGQITGGSSGMGERERQCLLAALRDPLPVSIHPQPTSIRRVAPSR